VYQRTVAQRVVGKSAMKHGGGKEIGFEGRTPRKQLDVIEEVIVKGVSMGRVNPNAPSITRLGVGLVTDFISVGKVMGNKPTKSLLDVTLGKVQKIGQPLEIGAKTDAGVVAMPEPLGIKINRYAQTMVSRTGDMPRTNARAEMLEFGRRADAKRSVGYLEVLRPGQPKSGGFKVNVYEPKAGSGGITKQSLDTLKSAPSEQEKMLGPDIKGLEKGFTSLQKPSSGSGRNMVTGSMLGFRSAQTPSRSQEELRMGSFGRQKTMTSTEQETKDTSNVGTISGYVPGGEISSDSGSSSAVGVDQIIGEDVIQEPIQAQMPESKTGLLEETGTGFGSSIIPLIPERTIFGGGGAVGWEIPKQQKRQKPFIRPGKYRTRIWPIEPNITKVRPFWTKTRKKR